MLLGLGQMENVAAPSGFASWMGIWPAAMGSNRYHRFCGARSRLGPSGNLAAASIEGVSSRRAIMAPPPQTRPPSVDTEVSTKRSEWSECLINDPMEKSLRVETWVFRTTDYEDFERLLKLRGFQLEGQQATLTCRERTVDPEVTCSECVRLLRGGYYGALGVSVPAFPPQREAVGCLQLSKMIDMPAPTTEED
eukprot:CAMPEP_0178439990 /NCGR_PEP_ID=MMETSP0689_2-20121128/36495_1 /TAXON_ID=160604 /ORGANISM="Amphidinium massartii, Strain CS-259" /LENGTH=193 /DNA_ID=CAMNT_0020062645 /DNA_START=41 /DNA_END=619 /DNA_ORIENTATION=-